MLESIKRKIFDNVNYCAQELEKAPPDELYGWRTHAWVLLLPNDDDITEPIFVEPSTGVSYPTSTDVYTSIESVFNHINYWVSTKIISYSIKSMILIVKESVQFCRYYFLIG